MPLASISIDAVLRRVAGWDSRSLPSLDSLRTPLWPWWTTSAIQMPRMAKLLALDILRSSSHRGS
jgi:hypothetical protein